MRIDRRSLICLAVSVALVATTTALVLSFGRHLELVPTVVVRGPWGAGPGEFGLDPGLRRGPPSFAVSPEGDWLVIADPFNERVVIVHGQKNPLIVTTPARKVTSVAASSILVFMLAGSELMVLDQNGRTVTTGHVPSTGVTRLSARLLSSPSGVLLEDTVLRKDELQKSYHEIGLDDANGIKWREMGMLTITWAGERRLQGLGGDYVTAASGGPAYLSTNGDGSYLLTHRGESWQLSVAPGKQVQLLWASPTAVFVASELLDGQLLVSRHPSGSRGRPLHPDLEHILPAGTITIGTRVAVDSRGRLYVAEADDSGYLVTRLEPRYRWNWRN